MIRDPVSAVEGAAMGFERNHQYADPSDDRRSLGQPPLLFWKRYTRT